MARRGNHEGNIRERADGSWEGCIAFDGRRYWARGKTRAEAQRGLAELKRQHAAAELVLPSRVTVAEHLSDWLEANRGNWRPSTAAGYEGIVRNYLEPAFGPRKLQTLTPPDLARQYGRWRDTGVGGRTLAIIHARLHRALREAVLWGLIPRNPADSVEPPRSVARRPKLWTPEASSRFAASLQGDSWDGALGALLLGGGLRLGEAFALRWSEVDFAAGTVRVERTRALIQRQFVEGAPKTYAGTRPVTLPTFAITVLRRWRKVQAERRLACGPAWFGEDRVVTLADGRTPGRWESGERLRKRAEALGLPPLRNHDLRHLSASLALSAGVPLPDVSRRLGHANVSITASIYAHALRADDAHVAAAIETMLATGAR
jgi:integrase